MIEEEKPESFNDLDFFLDFFKRLFIVSALIKQRNYEVICKVGAWLDTWR